MKTIHMQYQYQTYEYGLDALEGEKFDREFKPDLTPKQMLELGIFGGIAVNFSKGVSMAINDVDEYINQFDSEVKSRLLTLRELIKTVSPNAVEALSYGLIGYKLNGKPLVYFGGFKSHVGFYATPDGHEAFAEDFAKYKQGKGSVQFPLSQPLPIDLIQRVVRYRNEQTTQ